MTRLQSRSRCASCLNFCKRIYFGFWRIKEHFSKIKNGSNFMRMRFYKLCKLVISKRWCIEIWNLRMWWLTQKATSNSSTSVSQNICWKGKIIGHLRIVARLATQPLKCWKAKVTPSRQISGHLAFYSQSCSQGNCHLTISKTRWRFKIKFWVVRSNTFQRSNRKPSTYCRESWLTSLISD